jgi:hypothetical protein
MHEHNFLVFLGQAGLPVPSYAEVMEIPPPLPSLQNKWLGQFCYSSWDIITPHSNPTPRFFIHIANCGTF